MSRSPVPPGTRDAIVAGDRLAKVRDLSWLVAIAAGLWGLDAIFRQPLATGTAAATVVFAEHVVLVLVLLPVLPRALRAFRRADARARWCVIAIGAGASALATVLFTMAFRYGDPITPVVMQKLQPVVAMVAAAFLLRERLRPGFALFAVPALAGVWLLTFPQPLEISVSRVQVALLALGAAVLWAGGTVLGRLVSGTFTAVELTTLRFGFGLPASAVGVAITGAPLWVSSWSDTGSVVILALVLGLLAMLLYYTGLRRTPASRATLAELAFPLTAALVGVLWFHKSLDGSQWLGAALVVASVTALCWHESVSSEPAVQAPEPQLQRLS